MSQKNIMGLKMGFKKKKLDYFQIMTIGELAIGRLQQTP